MNWNCTKNLSELHHPIIATVQFLLGVCKHSVLKLPFFIYFIVIPWGTKLVLGVFLPIKVLCVSDYRADILLQFFQGNHVCCKSCFYSSGKILLRISRSTQFFFIPFPLPLFGGVLRCSVRAFCFVLFFHGLYSGLALIRLSQKICGPL